MIEYLPSAFLQSASKGLLFGFTAVAFAALALGLAGNGPVPPRFLRAFQGRPWILPGAFLVAGNAFVLVSRIPSIHFDGGLFNPDEAQMTAHAMQVCGGAFGWGGIDGGSAGPLLSIVLAWPCLFGADVSMLTGRVTAAVFVCAIATIVFIACRRAADDESAMLVTFPLFVFYGATSFFDFIHYSTELLPILLMVSSAAVFLHMEAEAPLVGRRLAWVVLAFIFLGLLPLAKLQALPIGMVIGLALLFRVAAMAARGRVSWRLAAVLPLLSAAPLVLALAVTLLQGDFGHFYKSYLLWAVDYVTSPANFAEFVTLAATVPLFWLSLASLLGMLVISLVARAMSLLGLEPRRRAGMLFVIAALPAAYVSIVTSGMKLFHYLHYALPFVALAAGVALAGRSPAAAPSGHLRAAAFMAGFVALAAWILPVARGEIFTTASLSGHGLFLVTPAQAGSRLMEWLRPARGDSLVIWGWMPQWYFRLGLPPGTREVTARNQIVESRQRNYFRQRWLDDFHRNRPDFVIDAVVPGSFGFQNQNTESIAIFPVFAREIEADFVEISAGRASVNCPRTYVRRARWEVLGKSLVEVASIAADAEYSENGVLFSAGRLDDRSVLEACHDYWLLPDGVRGGATLRLAKIERVAQVSVLNTRGGAKMNRGAKSLRLSLLREGRVVYEAIVSPSRFPLWTNHRLQRPVEATEVRIDILEFRGLGGGLNEVKIYRSEP